MMGSVLDGIQALLEEFPSYPACHGSRMAEALAAMAVTAHEEMQSKNCRPAGTAASLKACDLLIDKINAVERGLHDLPLEAHLEVLRHLGVCRETEPGDPPACLNEALRDSFRVQEALWSERLQVPKANLRRLATAVRMARDHLAAGSPISAPRSRPKKSAAYMTTVLAAIAFTQLTGLKPTRSTRWRADELAEAAGPFHAFLSRLFKIAGVKVHVDEQIKKYLSSTLGKSRRLRRTKTH
jgi:hypothetical protein